MRPLLGERNVSGLRCVALMMIDLRPRLGVIKTRLSAPPNIPDIQTETLPAISIIGICGAALRGMRPGITWHYGDTLLGITVGITLTLYLTPKLGNGIRRLSKVSP